MKITRIAKDIRKKLNIFSLPNAWKFLNPHGVPCFDSGVAAACLYRTHSIKFTGGSRKKGNHKLLKLHGSKLKGLSLLEAMLALGIGGIAIAQSMSSLSDYATRIKVKATASKIEILGNAVDEYANDNYENLSQAAPQELPIAVLAPYAGQNIGPDAFGNSYKLTTRTYSHPVPDPVNGGTMNKTALQILLVGEYADPSETELTRKLTIRSDIANAASSAAGFISIGELTCTDEFGNARPDGGICGAFGSYSIDSGEFSATDFTNVALVSLITKGDSSVFGDALYRFDYGDPDLNTMNTTLFMTGDDIDSPGDITNVDRITLDGGSGTAPAVIGTTDGKDFEVQSEGEITLDAENGTIRLNASNNRITFEANPVGSFQCVDQPCTDDFASFAAENGKLRIDNAETVFGNKAVHRHGSLLKRTGTGDIWVGKASLNVARAGEFNSLFEARGDALRLQRNRKFGEVIVGKRARYDPDGSGVIYELSDGDVTAQHVQVQDITCADCGGSLAAILPKWRHMGTYFIPDGTSRRVPKPNCADNRTRTRNRPAIGRNLPYGDSSGDKRYEAKIILVPRQMSFKESTGNSDEFNFWFRATDGGAHWVTEADTVNGGASALAQTYCVFVGGNPDPTVAHSKLEHPTTSDSSDFVHVE
ncbi:MAG: hypothetical protein OXD29_03720 [Roseovarius sp.]|nr:hypothetical protein [Roseovarius sp.]